MYYEQSTYGIDSVALSTLRNSYEFDGILDRYLNSLMDAGYARPALNDSQTDSITMALTREGKLEARRLINKGVKATKLTTFSDGATFSDGSRFSQRVPSSETMMADTEAGEEAESGGLTVDPTNWTGPSHVLTDAKKISQVRDLAFDLKARVATVNFRNEADRVDVQKLVEALVALCQMIEPDLSLIDRVTAHPKFKQYAAISVCVATIRGALGI